MTSADQDSVAAPGRPTYEKPEVILSLVPDQQQSQTFTLDQDRKDKSVNPYEEVD